MLTRPSYKDLEAVCPDGNTVYLDKFAELMEITIVCTANEQGVTKVAKMILELQGEVSLSLENYQAFIDKINKELDRKGARTNELIKA